MNQALAEFWRGGCIKLPENLPCNLTGELRQSSTGSKRERDLWDQAWSQMSSKRVGPWVELKEEFKKKNMIMGHRLDRWVECQGKRQMGKEGVYPRFSHPWLHHSPALWLWASYFLPWRLGDRHSELKNNSYN